MFPRVAFHLIFIGPESMKNRDSEFPLPPRTASNPFGMIVEDRISHQMKISTIVDYYNTIHQTGYFYPYDPYFDCFVLFHPGLGHPASSHEWQGTLPQLLETKLPIICTGYTEYDMQRDIKWVKEKVGGEMDMLMEPGENRFRSLRWDLNDLDPGDISCGNWGIWAFRGKRYVLNNLEVVKRDCTDLCDLGTRRRPEMENSEPSLLLSIEPQTSLSRHLATENRPRVRLVHTCCREKYQLLVKRHVPYLPRQQRLVPSSIAKESGTILLHQAPFSFCMVKSGCFLVCYRMKISHSIEACCRKRN